MKVTILQQDLLGPLQTVARSVGTRSALPVLDNILLATDGSKLKIAATNLEIGVIKKIAAQVVDAGEITVPARALVELVAGLKPTKLELETKEANLIISADKFRAILNGIPSSEFPAIPLGEGQGVTFKKEVISSCAQILFAAAVDEGRPQLTGVLTAKNGKNLDFVATDGFRLAHRQIPLESSNSHLKSLIPKKTFEELLRVISEEESEEVEILVSQNQVIFQVGQTIVSSRLIEGNFPSWEKIIPSQFVARMIVDKEEMLKAVKLAAIFAKNEANIITIKLSKAGIGLEAASKQLGSQQNIVEGQVEGEDLSVAFNAKFLVDAISNAPSSQLVIEFSGALTPALVKPMGVDGLEYVIMPVKI